MRGSGIVFAAVLLTLFLSAASSRAYTGGPQRAEISGYDPGGHRIFYRLLTLDESGDPPQVWYFDLDGANPSKAVRVTALEGSSHSAEWWEVQRRLARLRGRPSFDLTLSVRAESTGIDTSFQVTKYRLRATVGTDSLRRTLDLESFCDPLVRVRGLYEVPGRTELLAVLSHIGRRYGCEEADLPLLLRRGAVAGPGSVRQNEER